MNDLLSKANGYAVVKMNTLIGMCIEQEVILPHPAICMTAATV